MNNSAHLSTNRLQYNCHCSLIEKFLESVNDEFVTKYNNISYHIMPFVSVQTLVRVSPISLTWMRRAASCIEGKFALSDAINITIWLAIYTIIDLFPVWCEIRGAGVPFSNVIIAFFLLVLWTRQNPEYYWRFDEFLAYAFSSPISEVRIKIGFFFVPTRKITICRILWNKTKTKLLLSIRNALKKFHRKWHKGIQT